MFSVAKGLVSLGVHLLAQQGRLELDAPIGTYWPEFVAGGKDTITSRMVLGHRAGIPVLDKTLSFEEIAAWTPVIVANRMLGHGDPRATNLITALRTCLG